MAVPQVCLGAGDAVELGELLEFLGDWLVCDRVRLADSLGGFLGVDAYDTDQLPRTCPGSGSCLASATGSGSSAVTNNDGVSGSAGRRSPGGIASTGGFVG